MEVNILIERKISRLINELVSATKPENLFKLFDQHTADLGFTIVSYQHAAPLGMGDLPGPVTIFDKGFPKIIQESYLRDELYKNDPIFKAAMKQGTPIWWYDVINASLLLSEYQPFADFFKDSALGDGLAMPAYGPNGRNSVVAFGTGDHERRTTATEALLLQSYCQTLHLTFCKLTRLKRAENALSRKEIAVMTLVAQGQSTNEISTQMGVSINTVNTHLKRTYIKLDVTDRVTATLRFLAYGYLYE